MCLGKSLLNKLSGQWWLKPLIPALGKQSQVDLISERVTGQPELHSFLEKTKTKTKQTFKQKT